MNLFRYSPFISHSFSHSFSKPLSSSSSSFSIFTSFHRSLHESRISVLLTQDIPKLGLAGEAVSVRRGYARGFLIKRKLAVYDIPQNRSTLQTKLRQPSQLSTDNANNSNANHHDNSPTEKSSSNTDSPSTGNMDSAESLAIRKHNALEKARLQRIEMKFLRVPTRSDGTRTLHTIDKKKIYSLLVKKHNFPGLFYENVVLADQSEELSRFGEHLVSVQLRDKQTSKNILSENDLKETLGQFKVIIEKPTTIIPGLGKF